MKKLFTILSLLLVSYGFSQTTYYWVGGKNVAKSWAAAASWSTVLGGSGGVSRNPAAPTDILVFDGSNVGAGVSLGTADTIKVTNVPYQEIAGLKFKNNANVFFSSSNGTVGVGATAVGTLVGTAGNYSGQTIVGAGTSFTTFFTVGDFIYSATNANGTAGITNGIGEITSIVDNSTLSTNNGHLALVATQGTPTSSFFRATMVKITGNPGLTIDATSKARLTSNAPLVFKLAPGATGVVEGTLAYTTNYQKVIVDTAVGTSLTFESGSSFNLTGNQNTSPFGALANSTNDNVIFKSGSRYVNLSTVTPSTNSAGNIFGALIPASVIKFEQGSTFVQASATGNSVLGNPNRSYPNFILYSTGGILPAGSPMDTVTLAAGFKYTSNAGSTFPIKGDLYINDTLNITSTTSHFVFCGTVPQNILVGSSAKFLSYGIPRITVAVGSTLNLQSNLQQNFDPYNNNSFTKVFGTFNFGNNTITNAALNTVGTLQGYPTNTIVGHDTSTAVISASSPYAVTVKSGVGYTIGMQLTGTGVPANTFIVGTAVANGITTLYVNNPITPNATASISSNVHPNGSTIITSNTGGLAASIPTNGLSSYIVSGGTPAMGINYVFNGATTTPFNIDTNSIIGYNVNKDTTIIQLASLATGFVGNSFVSGAGIPANCRANAGNLTAVAAIGGIDSSTTTVTLTAAPNSFIIVGQLVTGTGIAANTKVAAISGTTITLSAKPTTKPNTAPVTLSFPILTLTAKATANGTNVFIKIDSPTTYLTRDVTTTAPVSSNVKALTISGLLNLNANNFTVPAIDTVKAKFSTAYTPSSFGPNQYIVLESNTTTGDKGYLRIDSVNGTVTFPVGTATDYLPVNVTAVNPNEAYSVNVFSGITTNAQPNGLPLASFQKINLVDAVWTIKKNFVSTTPRNFQLSWTNGLEGSTFSTLANSQIGVSVYQNNIWSLPTGSGDNTLNTASDTSTGFGSFSVVYNGTVLPVTFVKVSAAMVNASQIGVKWTVANQINEYKYVVEGSSNGIDFKEKGFVFATSSLEYSFLDNSILSGLNYYRIKAIDKEGKFIYSNVVRVASNKTDNNFSVNIYPNPVTNHTFKMSVSNASNETASVQLIDNNGRIVYTKSLNLINGVTLFSLTLPENILSGYYHLVLNSATVKNTQDIFVQ